MTHSEGWFLAVRSASGGTPLSMNSDLVIGLRLFNTTWVGKLEQRQHTYTHTQGHRTVNYM